MLKLKSYAKINLYLDIGEKLENGYHSIETLFQTIDLFDEICFTRLDKPVYRINCDHPEVPTGKDSILYQAVDMLLKEKKEGLEISIHKNIPLASGLGGGSSNIATVLLGICRLFHLKISPSELLSMASQFGMDVPFFILRGTVYAKGRGEILFPLTPIDQPIHLILINPGIKISTKWAYQLFDQNNEANSTKPKLNIQEYLDQERAIQYHEIIGRVYNRFDAIIGKVCPVIEKMKQELRESGISTVAMTGSGATVYGISDDKENTLKAYSKMKNKYPFACKTKTTKAENLY